MNLQIVEGPKKADAKQFGLNARFGWEGGTSGGGVNQVAGRRPPALILGGAFGFRATSGAASALEWGVALENLSQATSACGVWREWVPGGAVSAENEQQRAETSGAAVFQLRRLTGLTWEELARIFRVSRRSLHFWASGKPLAAQNEASLQAVLAAARRIDRGSASENRALLRSTTAEGRRVLDLLAEGRLEDVVRWAGETSPRKRPRLPPLSAEAQASRRPPRPEESVGALQDRVHRDTGKSRPVRAARAGR